MRSLIIGKDKRHRWLALVSIAFFYVIIYSIYNLKITDINFITTLKEECNRAQLVNQISNTHMGTHRNDMAHEQISKGGLSQNMDTSTKNHTLSSAHLSTLYIITATYNRASQAPDLTRLAQTLMSVPEIHWIIVEDSKEKTPFVSSLLTRMPLPWTHLNTETTLHDAKLKLRGCTQRSAGLEWILNQNIHEGIFYFADDDNAYDIRVFEELRNTKRIGIVPTGNIDHTGVSSPVVQNGHVVDFVDVWDGGRKWPIDMACFAVNIEFWRSRGAPLCKANKKGFIETQFLEDMGTMLEDFEPMANNCTQVLVWHTKTQDIKLKSGMLDVTKYKDTNIPTLISNTAYTKVLSTDKPN